MIKFLFLVAVVGSVGWYIGANHLHVSDVATVTGMPEIKLTPKGQELKKKAIDALPSHVPAVPHAMTGKALATPECQGDACEAPPAVLAQEDPCAPFVCDRAPTDAWGGLPAHLHGAPVNP